MGKVKSMPLFLQFVRGAVCVNPAQMLIIHQRVGAAVLSLESLHFSSAISNLCALSNEQVFVDRTKTVMSVCRYIEI